MSKSLTPSRSLNIQIGKFFHFFRLLKSRFRVWLQETVAEDEKTFTVIVNRVDYTRTPQEVIRATGREKYLNPRVVATMPRRRQGVVENIEVTFFYLGGNVSVKKVERQYEWRNLVPDPYAQAAVNEQEPAFADRYGNCTQWGRRGEFASYLSFGHLIVERNVYCRYVDVWYGGWWFAGVPKVFSPKAE